MDPRLCNCPCCQNKIDNKNSGGDPGTPKYTKVVSFQLPQSTIVQRDKAVTGKMYSTRRLGQSFVEVWVRMIEVCWRGGCLTGY